jgi:hypothetical protein
MKKQALTNIAQMWRKKQIIKTEVQEALGEYNLSETAEDIYVYAATTKVCIAHIRQNSYFASKSFSTIKRAVLELKACGLIEHQEDTVDRRVFWLIPIQEN